MLPLSVHTSGHQPDGVRRAPGAAPPGVQRSVGSAALAGVGGRHGAPPAPSVVAACDLANPIGGVARHSRNGGGGQSTRQQPYELPVPALDRVMGGAIPFMEFVVSQIRTKVNASWHASDIWNHWGERGRRIIIVLGSGVDLRGRYCPWRYCPWRCCRCSCGSYNSGAGGS